MDEITSVHDFSSFFFSFLFLVTTFDANALMLSCLVFNYRGEVGERKIESDTPRNKRFCCGGGRGGDGVRG